MAIWNCKRLQVNAATAMLHTTTVVMLALLCILTLQFHTANGFPSRSVQHNFKKVPRLSQFHKTNVQELTKGHSIHTRQTVQCNPRQCDDPATLQCIQESCMAEATPRIISNRTTTQSNDVMLSFCGPNCRSLIYEYGRTCGLEEFILNVSGVCTREREVQCIFAIIISKPGIFSCLPPEFGYGIQENEVPSSPLSDAMQCTMSSSFDQYVPYRFETGDMGDIEIFPPLKPPWGLPDQCNLYPDIVGHATAEPTTSTPKSVEVSTTVFKPTTVTQDKASSDKHDHTSSVSNTRPHSGTVGMLCSGVHSFVLIMALFLSLLLKYL